MRDFSLVTALESLARGWTGRYPRIVLGAPQMLSLQLILSFGTRCSRDRIPILARRLLLCMHRTVQTNIRVSMRVSFVNCIAH